MAKQTKASGRVIMRIELLPDARAKLESLCARLGLTQVATSSRVIDWLYEQDDVVQASILGLFPQDIRGEVQTMIFKRMAGAGGKKKS